MNQNEIQCRNDNRMTEIPKLALEMITDDWLILSVISYHFYLSKISFKNDNWRTDRVRNDNFDSECDVWLSDRARSRDPLGLKSWFFGLLKMEKFIFLNKLKSLKVAKSKADSGWVMVVWMVMVAWMFVCKMLCMMLCMM